MRRRRKQPTSVLDYCTAALGQTKGGLAAAWVAQWALAVEDLGHFPTTVEYADYWAISERTAWRHRSMVHSVFGEQWQDVVSAVAAAIDERRSPRAVMSLAVAV